MTFQAFGQERVSITLTQRQIISWDEVGSNIDNYWKDKEKTTGSVTYLTRSLMQ